MRTKGNKTYKNGATEILALFSVLVDCPKRLFVFGDNDTWYVISLPFRQFCIMVRYHSSTDNIYVTIFYFSFAMLDIISCFLR